MRVTIVNNQSDVKVGFRLKRLVARSIRETLKTEGYTRGDVTVLLTGEDEIRTLNRTYRDIDSATDVLSFPMDTEGAKPHIGDMAIFMKRAVAQGEEFGHGTERETAYLAAHSALHLVGYDHEDEAERAVMREKEEKTMTKIGLPRKN